MALDYRSQCHYTALFYKHGSLAGKPANLSVLCNLLCILHYNIYFDGFTVSIMCEPSFLHDSKEKNSACKEYAGRTLLCCVAFEISKALPPPPPSLFLTIAHQGPSDVGGACP